jgi:hypothetical protein
VVADSGGCFDPGCGGNRSRIEAWLYIWVFADRVLVMLEVAIYPELADAAKASRTIHCGLAGVPRPAEPIQPGRPHSTTVSMTLERPDQQVL